MNSNESILEVNQLHLGDCIEVMKGFPDKSIDCIVTDPPYGLEFMGKDWDSALPPQESFVEMCRVLKPGGLAFVMSSPRQDLMWRMMRLLEESGFELRQSFLSWIYKSGMPKGYDISKGIDKKKGLEQKKIGELNKKPPATNIYGDYGTNHNFPITEPNSVEAKAWDGYRSISGLKPAHEPILMVYKPLSESTIVDNVLRWGTGAINVDACRIPIDSEVDDVRLGGEGEGHTEKPQRIYGGGSGIPRGTVKSSEKGRFPANLVVSDKALDTGETTKSGKIEAHHKITPFNNKVYSEYDAQPPEKHSTYGDMGDQSRYFDLDKWEEYHGFIDTPKACQSERDFGCENLYWEIDSKRSSGYKRITLKKWRRLQRIKKEKKERLIGKGNIHPTVKPVQLMTYLVALGCPPGGIVLDPFMGSGTTCVGTKKLGRKYIGIELDPDYLLIAESRLNSIPFTLTEFFLNE